MLNLRTLPTKFELVLIFIGTYLFSYLFFNAVALGGSRLLIYLAQYSDYGQRWVLDGYIGGYSSMLMYFYALIPAVMVIDGYFKHTWTGYVKKQSKFIIFYVALTAVITGSFSFGECATIDCHCYGVDQVAADKGATSAPYCLGLVEEGSFLIRNVSE